jgi:uncharacterized protein with FMN-binding domain
MKTNFIIFIVITSSLLNACKTLDLEHEEARNVNISDIDFSKLKTGEYTGYYAGGMYGWRENECRIVVDSITTDSSKVVTIELVKSKAEYTKQFLDTLYNRVLAKQSLQIDAVSGATLDSKACLKAMENALIKAE